MRADCRRSGARRAAHDLRAGRPLGDPTRPTARGFTPRCSVRPERRDDRAGPRLDRVDSFWTYVIGDLSGACSAWSPTTCAATARASARARAATTRSSASARISRRCSRPALARRAARGRRRPLARRDVDRCVGRAVTTSERRASAAALLNTGVGDLIAESLLIPVPRVAQRAQPRASAVAASSARARPLPRFSTPISHASIRYVAFGADRVARADRVLRAHAGQPARPTCAPTSGSRLSEIDLHHALAAADRADARARGRRTTG